MPIRPGVETLDPVISEGRDIPREIFNNRKESVLLYEGIRSCVQVFLNNVRERCVTLKVESDEEYFYDTEKGLKFVTAVVQNETGSVVRTDYLPFVRRIKSGNTKAEGWGVVTVDGLFHPVRERQGQYWLDVKAKDKSGESFSIEPGLENDPQVVDEGDEIPFFENRKCGLNSIGFSFIDPKFENFDDNKDPETKKWQQEILRSLRKQMEIWDDVCRNLKN